MNPLDQLADINVPQTVSAWPLASGYWMLLGLACILIGLIIIWTTKYRNQNRARKQAILQLNKIETEDKEFAAKLQVILKTVVAHYRGTDCASKSYGQEWNNVLQKLYKGKNTEELKSLSGYLFSSLYSISKSPLIQNDEPNLNEQNVSNTDQDRIMTTKRAKEIALDFLMNFDTSKTASVQESLSVNPFGVSKC